MDHISKIKQSLDMTVNEEIEYYSKRSEPLRLVNTARKTTQEIIIKFTKENLSPSDKQELRKLIHDNACALGTLSGQMVEELKLLEQLKN